MENSNFFDKFALQREDMSPPYGQTNQIACLDLNEIDAIKNLIYNNKSQWDEILQKGNFKLSANFDVFPGLYEKLLASLAHHLSEPVQIQTPLDFFIFDKFDSRWETQPSGFIHNDWGNFAKCMQEFTHPDEKHYYEKENAIALVMPIVLPHCGSGLELYDAFHEEKITAKELLDRRKKEDYTYIPYALGEATVFCPFQYHSGYCAKKGTLKDTDSRIVLVAFLIRYTKNGNSCWHMFRMCKGATLEYSDKDLYNLDTTTLNLL